MKAAFRATKPGECWDWISGADLVRLTTQAFRRAKRDCFPPKGERFNEGAGWASPASFVESLTRLLVLHVQAEAHQAGIEGYECCPEQLARWYSDNDAGDNNAQDLGAGRSPADKGQGWPACSAGGPGAEVLHNPEDALPPENRFSSASAGKDFQ